MNRVLDRATPVLGAVGTKEATMMFKPRTMRWQYRRREVDHILMGGGLSFLTFAIC